MEYSKLNLVLLILSVLQILAGIYPIAQVREPYSAIAYLGQRLNLPKLLRLQQPECNTHQQGLEESEWSAMDICEGNQNTTTLFDNILNFEVLSCILDSNLSRLGKDHM